MRTAFTAFALVPALLVAGCGGGGDDEAGNQPKTAASPKANQGADAMASHDPGPGEHQAVEIPDAEDRPTMQAQVVLERAGFAPGVIDGKVGISTENALSGFQEANGLEVTGKLDNPTRGALSRWSNIPATRVVTIPESWARIDFRPLPKNPAEQAKMDRLGYETLDEKLAERFHTTIEVLKALNPDGKPAGMEPAGFQPPVASSSSPPSPSAKDKAVFSAGQTVRVPNIGADAIDLSQVDDPRWLATLRSLGVGTGQPQAARIVVDKSSGWLKAYDKSDKLVAMFTVTSGSSHDPLPLGNWGINGISYNPDFSYNPDLFWDVPDSAKKQRLPPGPNGPVGVVWIDLTKEHYGIHGTSAPETIGRAQSHGCVRLTNWDAARLAEMVGPKTKVVFQA